MPRLRVDAVLFDMDGTLIDESQSYREAIRMTAELLLSASVSREEVEEVKRVPGFNNDWDTTWAVIGRRLHGSIVPPSEADRGSYAYRRMQNVFQTYYLGDRTWENFSGSEAPFVWTEPLIERETPLISLEALTRLSGLKLGIATSRPRAEALLALHQHGMHRYFGSDALVAMEDAAFEKPHPAPLLELTSRLGVSSPVYVGDTINDAIAAFEAGMPFIHIGVEPLGEDRLDRQVSVRVQDVNEIVVILLDVPAPA